MRWIEHITTQARSVARTARAVAGVGGPGPARLDLVLRPGDRLDQIEVWQGLLAEVLRWRGPVPVWVMADDARGGVDPAVAAALARAAHRMDCPTTVLWGGGALSAAEALALIDAGAHQITVYIPSGVHADAGALAALARARALRGGGPALVAAVRWQSGALGALPAMVRAALDAGAVRVQLAPPLLAASVPATDLWAQAVAIDPKRVAPLRRWSVRAIDQMFTADDGQPGAPGGGRCPVAGLRLALTSDGAACACPHKGTLWAARAPAADAALPALWAAGQAHRDAIAACTRRCPALELQPPWA